MVKIIHEALKARRRLVAAGRRHRAQCEKGEEIEITLTGNLVTVKVD